MKLDDFSLTELKAMAWERAVLLKKIRDQLTEIHEMIKRIIDNQQGTDGQQREE